MTANRSGDAVRREEEQQSATSATVDDVLTAAARTASSPPRTPEHVLAAFRAARDEHALSLPTRPVDDWRAAEPPRRRRWIRAGAGALVGGVLLGGVAMATGAIPSPSEKPTPSPPSQASSPSPVSSSPTAEPKSGTEPSAPPAGDDKRTAERPPTAKDEAAHCRAYGKPAQTDTPADSAVRQRLEEAAGSPAKVASYCAAVLARSTRTPVDPSPEVKRPAPVTPKGSQRQQNDPADRGKPSIKP